MTSPDPLWRRLAREVWRTPQRLLHPVRRALARLTLRGLRGPQRLLFVCLGNICRSPYAHYRASAMLKGTEHRVTSGGFVGPGRPSPDQAKAVAKERGLDLTSHVSALVSADVVRRSSIVVVMDAAQARRIRALAHGSDARVLLLGDFDPETIDTRTVLDPWKQPVEEFRACYGRIDRCVAALVKELPDSPTASARGPS